jgi:hypothetical protein
MEWHASNALNGGRILEQRDRSRFALVGALERLSRKLLALGPEIIARRTRWTTEAIETVVTGRFRVRRRALIGEFFEPHLSPLILSWCF